MVVSTKWRIRRKRFVAENLPGGSARTHTWLNATNAHAARHQQARDEDIPTIEGACGTIEIGGYREYGERGEGGGAPGIEKNRTKDSMLTCAGFPPLDLFLNWSPIVFHIFA